MKLHTVYESAYTSVSEFSSLSTKELLSTKSKYSYLSLVISFEILQERFGWSLTRACKLHHTWYRTMKNFKEKFIEDVGWSTYDSIKDRAYEIFKQLNKPNYDIV